MSMPRFATVAMARESGGCPTWYPWVPAESVRTSLTRSEAARLLERGEFAPGSMGPKIEAAISYLDAIDGEVIICLPDERVAAIDGRAGTHIRRDDAESGTVS